MINRLFISALILIVLCSCATARHTGLYHTVKKGQTLYTISRVYEVDEVYLARINGISDPTELQIGDQIFIPGVTQARPVPITVKSSPPPPPPRSTPPARPTERKATETSQKTVASKSQPRPADPRPTLSKPPAAKDRFIWPVKGTIVKKFGANSSKGLEIAVSSGTPVAAAAAGKVIYSGSGIAGYGNLVIVRHGDSFFTIYGYNQKNIVSAGDFVSKGEKIAYSGHPPSGGKNRVYFEIRYGKKPVNPLTYLP